MNKLKLNNNQILGLFTCSFGIILQEFFQNYIGFPMAFFGFIVFLVSSKLNMAIIGSFFLLGIGYYLRILHLSMGKEIIIFSLISLIILSFVQFILKKYKLDIILIWLSFIILFIGFYLKIEHLILDNELMTIGYSLISISYFYRFIKKKIKVFEDYNKLLLVFSWSILSIFKMLHLVGSQFLSYVFIIILWSWLILSLIKDLKSNHIAK
ncbi:hypothetical protein [Aureivirga marina]|uniref:hypothetical protein n=1 Tax=Aureivirga marina TaxID=1182451 RepID=UPI0018CB85DE|nr:hypothetical protein [Aureivirga marina]